MFVAAKVRMIWLPPIFEIVKPGPRRTAIPRTVLSSVNETTLAQGLVALGSFEEAARERRSGTASGCNASTLGFPTLVNFDQLQK
jgi:hypothetical protein